MGQSCGWTTGDHHSGLESLGGRQQCLLPPGDHHSGLEGLGGDQEGGAPAPEDPVKPVLRTVAPAAPPLLLEEGGG